jgi:hypothetical protein
MNHSLTRDLNQHDRELEQADADQEFRDSIREETDEIEELLCDLSFENLIKARSHAQYIIDYLNERLP